MLIWAEFRLYSFEQSWWLATQTRKRNEVKSQGKMIIITKKQREKYLKCCKTHTFWDEIEVLKFYYRKAYIKLKLLSRKHLSEIPRFMNRLLQKSPETSADGTKTEMQNWLVITVLHYRITKGPMLGGLQYFSYSRFYFLVKLYALHAYTWQLEKSPGHHCSLSNVSLYLWRQQFTFKLLIL